ncbi:MAG: hypothetical protein ACRCXT_00515 [Paraclostridium sp.]
MLTADWYAREEQTSKVIPCSDICITKLLDEGRPKFSVIAEPKGDIICSTGNSLYTCRLYLSALPTGKTTDSDRYAIQHNDSGKETI